MDNKSTTEPKCADCGSPMEAGYIPDYLYLGVVQLAWHPGKIAIGLLGGMKAPNSWQGLQITAYRCTACGFLKLFAPGPAKTDSETHKTAAGT